MADFSANSPFPLLDNNNINIIIDPNMDSQFSEISPLSLLFDNINLPNNFNTTFLQQTQNFPSNIFHQNLIIPNSTDNNLPLPVPQTIQTQTNKRKAFDISESSNSFNSSPQVPDCGKGKYISRRRKKAKEEVEKPKEVVHVRARRGQATDSHSLAERVRRGKINERLKCLQDIVPGCYKTMGMAVMLDEIINYVQSLQNQVEFLSMKLTAASTFYDFNSETDAIERILRAKVQEAKEMDRGLMSMSTHHHHPSWSL